MADISQFNINNTTYNFKDTEGRTQVEIMPTASADLLGKICQFVGTTDVYTNGFFYKCVPGSTSGTYEWVPVAVQSGGGGGSNVQSDWNQTDSTADDYIKNKPTLGTASTKDSTNAVTANSTDLVESGAVYASLQNKQDIIQVSTMPTASQDINGKIVQYIGADTSTYFNGWFYQCDFNPNGGGYKWYPLYTDTVNSYNIPITSAGVYAVTSTLQKKITQSAQITIATNAWNSSTLTCSIDTSSLNIYDLGRSIIDIETGENSVWDDFGVYMDSYTTGTSVAPNPHPITSITFKCDEVPDQALHFYVTSMEVN